MKRRQQVPVDAPKANIRELSRLTNYLKPYRKSLLGVCVALTFSSLAVLSMGAGLRYLIDSGFHTGDGELLDQALLILLCIIMVLAVSTYARFYLVTRTGERVIADIRQDIYRHLIHLSPAFYESRKTGEVISRMTADTSILQMVIGSSLSIALRNILLFMGGIIMLISTSPMLTGYIAIMIPAVVLPILLLGKKVRRLSQDSQEKVGRLAAHVEESLAGLKVVQAYTQEENECNHFAAYTENAFTSALARIRIRAVLTAIVIVLAFGSVGMILWLGGKNVLHGEISAGQLSSFIFYSVLVASSFGALTEVMGDIQRAAGSTEELMRLLNTASDICEVGSPQTLPQNVQYNISFNHVTFFYPTRPNISALTDFSLDINEGETVALVGPSGAGKTTVLQLLMRFYDPMEGVISVGGVPIHEMSLKNLRQCFAYVPQDTTVFSTTVRENIAYGRDDASVGDIIRAARSARAWDFIQQLPQGLDTYLGEKGVRLSGGERQRVAIARAILYNPPILLLDEATSALDAENETLVQEALNKLMQHRTTIVIAHRLSTVQNADRIIVMNEGGIEATGTHEELLHSSPLYTRLAELQFNV